MGFKHFIAIMQSGNVYLGYHASSMGIFWNVLDLMHGDVGGEPTTNT